MEQENSPDHAPRKRILVVDSNMMVRRALIRLLNSESGLQICGEAENREQTLEQAGATEADIVIIDLDCPDLHGLDLVSRLVEKYPKLPVLGISMREGPLCVRRVIEAGGKGYLTKHEAASKVSEAIRTLLGGGVYTNGASLNRRKNVRSPQ